MYKNNFAIRTSYGRIYAANAVREEIYRRPHLRFYLECNAFEPKTRKYESLDANDGRRLE